MEIANKILEHLKNNPQITEGNYDNINPYFREYGSNNQILNSIYIGYDYIINIYGDKLYLENIKTGKITKRKIKR